MNVLDRKNNKEEILENYLNKKAPIMNTKRLDLYKDIMKHYKRIDNINIEPEEPEDQFKTSTGETYDEEKNDTESKNN